ncbi:MAG: tyrosine-type recombinase/integrase [Rhodospirillaceae bacterium]
MAKLINRLTDAKARKAAPGMHPDGDGLYLQVRGETAKSWIYKYWSGGKSREMGLGAYPSISLEMARSERDRYKRLRQEGKDPIETRAAVRMEAKLASARSITFSRAALEYMATKAPQWGNEKHRKQWIATLKTYAEPILGEVPVQVIDTTMVKKVLDPIWTTKPETASRLRGRIELILDYCTSLGYRAGENPARWRGNLKDVMPHLEDIVQVEHHLSMPYTEMPTFMERLRAMDSVAARALEWTILTGVRANEALKALPEEVSKLDRVWCIPKGRMKGRKSKKQEHRVPLSARAIELFEQTPRVGSNPYLFQGLKSGQHLSDGAVRVLLARMGVADRATTHGFRATFRTWAAEQTNFPWEVCEKALAHSVGDETRRAYERGDLFEKRRLLMDAWARYCASPMCAPSGTVIPIRAAE